MKLGLTRMKIEYICHSTLMIDTGDCKIVTDPWIKGSAYCNQWHLFPKPVNANLVNDADVLLFSHGHEDHLHDASLRSLRHIKKAFYPYQWQKGIKEYFEDLGCYHTTEAVTGTKYQLGKNTWVTFIANALDSVMVIESNGEVLLNINDALTSNPLNVIDIFIEKIKASWPRIDYLFCGFGSASYFPNTIHHSDKNDKEIAEAREQVFAHHFCHIVDRLKPKFAVPFAADWVLLNADKRWINDIRYSKESIIRYYHDVFKGADVNLIEMHSSDVFENGEFKKHSAYHGLSNDQWNDLIETQLKAEIREVNSISIIDENSARSLQEEILANIKLRLPLFNQEVYNKIIFTLIVSDMRGRKLFNVDLTKGEPVITRSTGVHSKSMLTMETTSTILRYSFASEWGGDAIIIGYGVDIHILDKSIITKNLDILCVRLLTRQPVASKQMKRSPLRAAKYLLTNPLTTKWAITRTLSTKGKINKNPLNERETWLTKTKCEVCQVCDIPYTSSGFPASTNSNL